MINSHKVTKHACTSSWPPLAHSIHHTYHQVIVMNKQQKNKGYKQLIYIYIYISHVNVTQTVPDISPLMPMHQDPLLVGAWWRIYVSAHWVIIGSGNGLAPVQCRPITWTNCDLLQYPITVFPYGGIAYCQSHPHEQILVKPKSKYTDIHSQKCIKKHRLQNVVHFVPSSPF